MKALNQHFEDLFKQSTKDILFFAELEEKHGHEYVKQYKQAELIQQFKSDTGKSPGAILNMDDLDQEFAIFYCEYMITMLKKLQSHFDNDWHLQSPKNEMHKLVEARAELIRCERRMIKILKSEIEHQNKG